MSTIPLTFVEGSIAMPRARPLDRLPAPFGRDWALLPPGHSWRVELKALYAAMLHTFCMSNKTILSLCRWVPLSATRAAAPDCAAATTRTTVLEAPRTHAAQALAEATLLPEVERPALGSVSRRSSPHRAVLAGGVCVLSGAAMLAWIAFTHLGHRPVIDAGKPADNGTASGETQAAQRRKSDAAAAQGLSREAVTDLAHRPAIDAAKPADNGTASGETQAAQRRKSDAAAVHGLGREAVREGAAGKLQAPPASVASANGRVAPRQVHTPASLSAGPATHAVNNDAFSRRREAVDKPREKNDHRTARSAIANRFARVAPMSDDMPRITVPRTAQRGSPAPSARGAYSPPAPAQPGFDEYADVTMSAATPVRDVASSRSATSNRVPAASSTEWMNHMSQRRVTEIPDQFAK
jgi:hypothetical protein